MIKVMSIAIISFFILSAVCMAADNPFHLDKLEEGLDNVVYGTIETPDNIDETNTKGKPAFKDCTAKTNSGLGRAVAKIVGGAWQIATFWYPKEESATTARTTKRTKRSSYVK